MKAAFAATSEETKSNSTSKSKSLHESNSKMSSILSESKNASFLNQELQFFVKNLKQKALESGLDSSALFPKQTDKEKKCFDYLSQADDDLRPQSAKPQNNADQLPQSPSRTHKNPTKNLMNSSFYSISMLSNSELDLEE